MWCSYYITLLFLRQVSVVIATFVLAGVNIWSFTMLRQDFNLYDYIPSDSYATEYINAQTVFYPDRGYEAAVYCGKTNSLVYLRLCHLFLKFMLYDRNIFH